MKGFAKVALTTAATAVLTAFAVYVATPHFGDALALLGRFVREPLVWGSLVAIWLGLWCLQQWWGRLQHSYFDQSGWWTALWFFVGVGLSVWGACTMYSTALPLV